MAIHVWGVVLPDDEVRDLWLVGDRVTLDLVPGAETVNTTGFILPGLAVPVPPAGRRPRRTATGPGRPARRAGPPVPEGHRRRGDRRRPAGHGGRAGQARQRLGEAGRR